MSCPITRGCRTRFTDEEAYFKCCLDRQGAKSSFGKSVYFSTCSVCENFNNPKELLYGAEVMTLVELVKLRKKYKEKSI